MILPTALGFSALSAHESSASNPEALCQSQSLASVKWQRSATLSSEPHLSRSAKINLICAGIVVFVLLVILLQILLHRCYYRYCLNNRCTPGNTVCPRDVWAPSALEAENFNRLQQIEIETVLRTPEPVQQIDTQFDKTDSPQHPSPHNSQEDQAAGLIRCEAPNCHRTFTYLYEYNHHKRYHTKPLHCPSCNKSFGTVTHIRRHINDVHKATRKYYCVIEGCKYVKFGESGRFFSRKDNWRRHLRDRHGKMGEDIKDLEVKDDEGEELSGQEMYGGWEQ